MRSTRSEEKAGSRRWRKGREVEAILEEYRKSGSTQRVFAREAGIGVSTLQLWLRQKRQGIRRRSDRSRGKEEVAPALPLLEVKLQDSGEGGVCRERRGYELELRGGGCLRVASGFADEEVRRLLQLLKEVG